MSTANFFDEGKDQSIVKATIVNKYFWAWARVMLANIKKYGRNTKIAYIDLFAGPGRYKDGTTSTPIRVLQQAIEDEELSARLVTFFNDANGDHSKSLESEIKKMPGVEKLRYEPVIFNEEVGQRIVKMFEDMTLIPTFFFVDPWGYKGLSLRLVNSVVKDWGCDCIFFFNYNRINMGINNPAVKEHMNALFGVEKADELRAILPDLTPIEREECIVNNLAEALKEYGAQFILPFCFKNEAGTRTSHHLIFVTKHFRGYEIMKEIMAGESSDSHQGVPSLTYCPAPSKQGFLFELNRPLDDLEGLLLTEFSGQTLTLKEIYERHSVDKPYIRKNYREALLNLEEKQQITTDPSKRRKNTFAVHVKATFP